IANICSYRSSDAGKTFTALKGAPGGDDYHTFWINPENPQIIALASDQGATISVNGGQTWSSWYNQPTAQFYHVITDNQFPYWVYGGSRRAAPPRGAGAAITAQLLFAGGVPRGRERSGWKSTDMWPPIRSIQKSFTAARSRAMTPRPRRLRTYPRSSCAPENFASIAPLR